MLPLTPATRKLLQQKVCRLDKAFTEANRIALLVETVMRDWQNLLQQVWDERPARAALAIPTAAELTERVLMDVAFEKLGTGGGDWYRVDIGRTSFPFRIPASKSEFDGQMAILKATGDAFRLLEGEAVVRHFILPSGLSQRHPRAKEATTIYRRL